MLATFLNPTFKGKFLKDEKLAKKMLFEKIRQSMKSQLSKEKNSSSSKCKTPSKMDGSTSESDGNLIHEDEPEGS